MKITLEVTIERQDDNGPVRVTQVLKDGTPLAHKDTDYAFGGARFWTVHEYLGDDTPIGAITLEETYW